MFIIHPQSIKTQNLGLINEINLIAKVLPFTTLSLSTKISISKLKFGNEILLSDKTLILGSVSNSELEVNLHDILSSISVVNGDLDVVDLRDEVENEMCFNSANSIVFSNKGGVAIGLINDNTDEELFEECCEILDVYPIRIFGVNQGFISDFCCSVDGNLLIDFSILKNSKTKKELLAISKNYNINVLNISNTECLQHMYYFKRENILLVNELYAKIVEEQILAKLNFTGKVFKVSMINLSSENILLKDFIFG